MDARPVIEGWSGALIESREDGTLHCIAENANRAGDALFLHLFDLQRVSVRNRGIAPQIIDRLGELSR